MQQTHSGAAWCGLCMQVVFTPPVPLTAIPKEKWQKLEQCVLRSPDVLVLQTHYSSGSLFHGKIWNVGLWLAVEWQSNIIITRVSEVIMFSPCVFVTLFVCLFVCLCLYHDVCPDDFTMKDCCHTNNILQVHCWGCLVVQVMFHALMTSSMTSPGHKVGQILKVIYFRQYLS